LPPVDAKITETRTEGRSGLLLAHDFEEPSGVRQARPEDGFTRGEEKLPLPRFESGGSGLDFSHASESKARQRMPAFSFSFSPSSGELLPLRE